MLQSSPSHMFEGILAMPQKWFCKRVVQKWFWLFTLSLALCAVVLPLSSLSHKYLLRLPTNFCLSFDFISTVAFFSPSLVVWFVDMTPTLINLFVQNVVKWPKILYKSCVFTPQGFTKGFSNCFLPYIITHMQLTLWDYFNSFV